MSNKITPHLISLTYDAALNSFWRKQSLKIFLRECKISENFLATWNIGEEGESKREFLDRLFEKLQNNSQPRSIITKIAQSLTEQTTFPDLRNWEDSDQKISKAAKAVKDLKSYINKQNEETKTEKEKEDFRKTARDKSLKIQRDKTDLLKLRKRLDKLQKILGTKEGGYAFQDWFYDMLDFFEIVNRRPYNSNGRQIDGSLTLEGTTYVVELKFTGKQSTVTDIDSLYKKAVTKADNTMGIMISISGYSSNAISEASGDKTPLLLMDHSHLYYILSGTMKISDVITRIRRHASQTAESYLPINKFSG